MTITRVTHAAAAVVLVAGLAACGGGDSKGSNDGTAGSGATPAAGSGGTDNTAPGTGTDAYKTDDPYVSGQTTKAAPKTIVFSGFAFVPTTITAKPGEMWTEDNQDIATHNISSLAAAKAKGTGGDIAPDVDPGKKATFKMPTKPGTYKVVCFYHQNMTATITVKK
jgi:plastocyanin